GSPHAKCRFRVAAATRCSSGRRQDFMPPARCIAREPIHKEKVMLQSGRVGFGAMETVVFGKPAAETVAEEARRRDAERVFLMVSGTLNRTTDEIARVRRALGNRFAGLFDHMPPHTPRHAVIEAAEMTREAGADLIVTVGGGSITDGAKVVQLCLANDDRNAETIDSLRPVKSP